MINDWQWLESLLVGIFKLVEQNYNQQLLVIPDYKGLKSSERLDGNVSGRCIQKVWQSFWVRQPH